MIATYRWMSEPPCARQGVPHGQTESGGIVLAAMLGPERAETVLPDRALYLPTASPLLIVNTTSLSVSLSLVLLLLLLQLHLRRCRRLIAP